MARLLPPESASLEVAAREMGVRVATLVRWREETQTRHARERAWSEAAQRTAVCKSTNAKNLIRKPAIALPSWFDAAFGHLSEADRAEVEGLWRDEPALRALALRLATLRPDVKRFRSCPRCGHNAPQWRSIKGGTWRGYCTACDTDITTSENTPFHRIQVRNWPKLYATLVLEWGPWRPYFAGKVAHCTDNGQFNDYRRRLSPLFDELPDDVPLVSHVRYRMGFSPAQQGFRCPHCGDDDLRYSTRRPADKPMIECRHCGKQSTVGVVVRRLPLPPDLQCPECGGHDLRRQGRRADGRRTYPCRDCGRVFIENPKIVRPSRAERVKEDFSHLRCPTCQGNKINGAGWRSEGRRGYRCAQCGRTFCENPKHVPTRLRHPQNGAPPAPESDKAAAAPVSVLPTSPARKPRGNSRTRLTNTA